MRNNLKILCRSLILLATVLVVTSCDRSDDINAIFRERTWYLTYIQEGDTKRFPKEKQLYSIIFKNDKFTATMPSGSMLKGTWNADGGERHSFYCRNIEKEGKIAGDTIAEKMYNILRNATSYEGDTNWLQIKQDKKTYMQFYNK